MVCKSLGDRQRRRKFRVGRVKRKYNKGWRRGKGERMTISRGKVKVRITKFGGETKMRMTKSAR